VLVFAIVRLIPGDPARILAGDFATDQVVQELRQRWQLDRPLSVQYAAYLTGLVRGDLGRSTATSLPVAADLRERFLRNLGLASAAIVIDVLVGGIARILGATRRASVVDNLATVVALVGVSTPIFWSGLILILLFSGVSSGCRREAREPCPPGAAGGQPGALRRRRDRAADALEHARSARRRIRAHRALEGSRRAGRGLQARTPERAHPGRDRSSATYTAPRTP